MRKIIDRNRVVLPSAFIKHWGLAVGDYVSISLSPAGDELYVRPVRQR